MLATVDRYVLLEVVKVFAAILLGLMLIVASLLFLRTLEEVNLGALSVQLVLRFLGLQMLRDSPVLMPPAFFVATLVALSRLARDSELIALYASGIGPLRLYRALVLLALPVAALTAWSALVVQPWAAAGIQEVRLQQKEQATQVAGLQAGRFYVEEQGDLVVYIGRMDRRQSLVDIFLLDRRTERERLVVSAGGRHQEDPLTGDHLVTLADGHRFDGAPGSRAFLIGDFGEYRIRIRADGSGLRASTKRSTTPTTQLLVSSELADRVELQHRLAAPLAVLTLTLITIPLVTVSPRQRTSGRLFLAFLAYVSFFNLQRLAESWLETGVTPDWLGSLWYQPLVLVMVYMVLALDSLWLRRLTGRWRRAPAG